MLFEITILLATHAASCLSLSETLYNDEEKRLYNFGLGKRAYSYVSEFKRLPVYNFGLGKRSVSDAKAVYGFGLGKRDENEEADDTFDDTEKRSKYYDFGLGKRVASSYNFGLGKKAMPHYSFGLGKRLGYNFGLGKRQEKYAFGLGKRSRPYSFGVGKRSINYYTGNDDDDFEYIDTNDEKRSSRLTDGQKFAFGLGKRENTLDDLLETSEVDNSPERQIRAPNYKFGLGKRSLSLKTLSSSQVGNKETTQDGKTIQ